MVPAVATSVAGRRLSSSSASARARTCSPTPLAPAIAATSLVALDLLETSDELRRRLDENTAFFRSEIVKAGFDVLPGTHPIVPVMIGDAGLAARIADGLLTRGVYVIGFSYPVVPRGAARIRVQISAAHTRDDLELAVAAFGEVRTGLT